MNPMNMALFNDDKNQGLSCMKFFDNSTVAFGHLNGTIQFWKYEEEDDLILFNKTIKVHSNATINLEKLTKEHIISSDQLEIIITDINKEKKLREFRGHSECIYALKTNPFGNILISGGSDKMIIIWDIRANKPANAILAHASEITDLDICFDSTIIASSSTDGYCRLWNIYDGRCIKTLMAENAPPSSSIRFSKNSKILLCSYLNDTILIWDRESGRSTQSYLGHKNENLLLPSYFISGKESDKKIIAPSEDNKVMIWDINNQIPTNVIDLTHINDKLKYFAVEEKENGYFGCIIGKTKAYVYSI